MTEAVERPIIVTLRDMAAAGVCVSGGRDWFVRHGLSFREFCRDGMPIETLRSYGDPIVERVCVQAEIRHGR